MRLTFFWHRC